jgi:hypothetical protein
MTTYFVNASRLSIALVNGPERQRELIGPFDDWLAASHYAVAWRNLWKAEQAEAQVETPLTPCVDVLEWYEADLARREATADAMFASEARDPFANTAQWEASIPDKAREVAYCPILGRDMPVLAPGEFRFK